MIKFWKKIFGQGANRSLDKIHSGELEHVKQEADHLAAALDSKGGLLDAEEMERLHRLTEEINQLTRRIKQE